jgi:iron complex transport system permease protein
VTDILIARPREASGRRARLAAVYAGLTGLLIASVLVGFNAGRFPIAPSTVTTIVLGKLLGWEASWSLLEERIVTLARGPRIMLVTFAGAGLAIAGATMQGIFRNPLASPQILGVSSGAAFGGALAILIGLSGLLLIVSAFVGGVVALLLVGFIARIGGRSDTMVVILAGVVVGTFFSAMVSVTQLLADPQTSLPAIVFWLMGSFASANWERVAIAVPPIAIGLSLLLLMRFRINVLSLGEEEASALGIDVGRDRWIVFLLVALIVGATVAVAGVVGWVGLVVPHAARLLVGHDHRQLLPASALLGASYLSLVDTAARTATSIEIPLGILTAAIGAPIVAILLRRMQRAKGMEP